jgi:hypothetical protein
MQWHLPIGLVMRTAALNYLRLTLCCIALMHFPRMDAMQLNLCTVNGPTVG